MTNPNYSDGAFRAPFPFISMPTRQDAPRIVIPDQTQDVYDHGQETRRRPNLRNPPGSYLVPQSISPTGAPYMSRSRTTDSYTSVSTSRSPTGDGPSLPATSTRTNASKRQRRPRGKRKGPLQPEARRDTALKRKHKTTCSFHRMKKTRCDCVDLATLDGGSQRDAAELPMQPDDRLQDTHQRSAQLSLPAGQSLNTEQHLFGTGGAATSPSIGDSDINELMSPTQPPTDVRLNVIQAANLDIHSVASVNSLTRISSGGHAYHPGTEANVQLQLSDEQDAMLAIGSEMLGFLNRWRCEYEASSESESDASSCSWTGPLRELCTHFRVMHHSFDDLAEPERSLCTACKRTTSGWRRPPQCNRSRCPVNSWQKWYYGHERNESITDSLPALTQSAESESGFSRTGPSCLPSMPNRTGHDSGGYNVNSWTGSYYEHSNNGKEDAELGDDQLGCSLWRADSHPVLLTTPLKESFDLMRLSRHQGIPPSLNSFTPPRLDCSSRDTIPSLSYCSMFLGCQLTPILICSLVAAAVREGVCLALFQRLVSMFTAEAWAIGGRCLLMVVLGFSLTWNFKNHRRRRTGGEESDHRQWDRRQRLSNG